MSRANADEDPLDLAYECPSVNFYEIVDASRFEFEEAMRIYIESFPENERRPVATIKEMLKSGKSRLMVGERDRLYGVALSYKGHFLLARGLPGNGRGLQEHRNRQGISDAHS
jgi:hypothetical protein